MTIQMLPKIQITLLTIAMLSTGGAGCAAGIGDECSTSSDCLVDNAVCDTTVPDGYCTRTPCESGACGEDAVCIEYPNGETFCMASCDSNDDCREGFRCLHSTISDADYCYIE